jgi:hypothetical protein
MIRKTYNYSYQCTMDVCFFTNLRIYVLAYNGKSVIKNIFPIFSSLFLIYIALIIFTFSESGFFVPGDSVIFSVGLLAAIGYVHIGIAIILILLASFDGDIIGYAYG